MRNFIQKYVYSKQNTPRESFVYILTWFYLIPFGCIIIFNMFCSLFQTAYMELYLDTEKPLYKADSSVILLSITLLGLIFFAFLFKKCTLTPLFCRRLRLSTCLYTAFICIFIIYLYVIGAECDSGTLSDIAVDILNGDYSSFLVTGYMGHYPHQTGMLALIQLVYAVFGIRNYTILQLINVAAIVATVYYLHRIAEELFDNLEIQFWISVLCISCLPLQLFSTFIYGDIPGLGLSVAAIYYVIRYLNTQNKKLLLPTSILMMFAVVIKSNNIIILFASLIILVLHSFSSKNKFALFFAIIIAITPTLGTYAVNSYYTKAGNLEEFPEGIPKIAWIAMGLQTNDYLENGWYNSYNWSVYDENNYDKEAVTEACTESIKASLTSFIEAPRSSGLDFFYKKFISQWNSPNFNSQIITEWYSRHTEGQHPFATWLIYDEGRFLLQNIMNFHHFLTLFGTSVYVLHSLKKWSLSSAFFSLCIFGGYFFHMFWEAGGRYGLGYFVLCIPLAAYGLSECTRLLQNFIHKKHE